MTKRIAITAPARALDRAAAEAVLKLNREKLDAGALELVFHPQCFSRNGHFAGTDAERASAFLEAANDPSFDAVWFARGGYGSCRFGEDTFTAMSPAAMDKIYLGYSDLGFVLARLQSAGIGKPAHGPMPADILHEGGEAAILRVLNWLAFSDASSLEATPKPSAPVLAFNIMVLASAMSGTNKPNLAGRILMLEEVGEHLYAMDRALFAIFMTDAAKSLAGVMLGRVSHIPENDIEFGATPEAIIQFWCKRAGVPYLGRADIGHDAENKIVPFG
ncbi:MAG: LD-carboxypeptidase [Pseudomonadota bacterium]